MPEDNFFVFKEKIKAPAEQIYRAFTSATSLREWLCDISTTLPEVGGRIYLAWHRGYFATGHFIKLVQHERVVFSWIGKEEPNWTKVDVSITPLNTEEGFMVELRHTGIGKDADWAEAREEITKGWKMSLENLKATLEKGRDLRIMNRPLIGIYPEDVASLTENSKERLEIPVDYGVLVTDVIPEYGAQKAGIRADDVIVAIDGEKVDRIRTLGVIMNKFTPRDQIDVEIFRGSEKLELQVQTMSQKQEEIADTPEELAKEFEERLSEELEVIVKAFKGVTDAEASYSPGPEEWSAKEILVHLIHNERDLHGWINDLVSGQERFYDEWPGDQLFRIRATLVTYQQVNDLIAELRRTLKESVASVAFIDPEFTKNKIRYSRLFMGLYGAVSHIQEHIRQIEDNIKAARDSAGA